MTAQRPHPPRPAMPLDGISPAPYDDELRDEATGLPRVDHDDLATALRVIKRVTELPAEHADAETIRRATDVVYKGYKKKRRAERRAALQQHDAAITAQTATGHPQRIDDETAGLPLAPRTARDSAGEYARPINCYICKEPFTRVDAFYHQLCPQCAALNHAKRDQRTDLRGRRALLTGGRAKIGMYIALRLLRDGADLTITTRFPKDAARRFAGCEDSRGWLHRLHIVGIDLRDPAQVVSLAELVAAGGPLDIIINNAAQTVRRSPGAYAPLIAAEDEPLEVDAEVDITTFDRLGAAHPAVLMHAPSAHRTDSGGATDGEPGVDAEAAELGGTHLTRQSLIAGNASLQRHRDGTAVDAGGLLPDAGTQNSWTTVVGNVSPLELLEVQLCNQTAPFILLNMLRPALAASTARRKYVVNVSAMEGIFMRGYKGPGHPHTNMAKAALNMMVRTSAGELFEKDRVLLTAVDTGWITDERPHETKVRLAEEGFKAPLDLVDGAARVYDPIVQGEAGTDLFGVFLKDYEKYTW